MGGKFIPGLGQIAKQINPEFWSHTVTSQGPGGAKGTKMDVFSLTRAGKRGANWNDRYEHLCTGCVERCEERCGAGAWVKGRKDASLPGEFHPTGPGPCCDRGWDLKPALKKTVIPASVASSVNLNPGMSSS